MPVRVEQPSLTVHKTAVPTNPPLDEPGGSVTYTVKVTNGAVATSVTLTELDEDTDNDGTVDTVFNATSTPTLASICDKTLIGPGQTVTCTFTGTVSGEGGQSFTDKACVKGIDSNGNAVPSSGSACVRALSRPRSRRRTTDPSTR